MVHFQCYRYNGYYVEATMPLVQVRQFFPAAKKSCPRKVKTWVGSGFKFFFRSLKMARKSLLDRNFFPALGNSSPKQVFEGE